MKRNTPYLNLLLMLFPVSGLLFSCSKAEPGVPQPKKDTDGRLYFENQQELVDWHSKSITVLKNKKIGEFDFTLNQVSTDMMALQELHGKAKDEKTFNEAKMHYSDMLYFRLNIQNSNFHKELLKYNAKTNNEYSRRINYCAFDINKDLSLTNGKDTVPCSIHQFERTFNVDGGLNFMLAFPRLEVPGSFTVIFQDQLFKNGIIKFYFDQLAQNLPYFKIK